MHRSRLTALLPLALLAAALLAPASAHAAPAARPVFSAPRLAYVLTTGSVRAELADRLHLTASQDARLRTIGFDLERAQKAIQRRSDVVVMDGAFSMEEKQAIIASSGYNGTLAAAEDSAAVRAASVVGTSTTALATAVEGVWQEDAALHKLETELTALGVTPQALAGGFHVYATRFYDEYATEFGVALPDRYAKYANKGWGGRPAGYPDGLGSKQIPLGSRILLACDAFHAMTSDRPYRRAMPAEEALQELRRNSGSQFAPDVVTAFFDEYVADVWDAATVV
jgi:hypothetical protein